MTKEEIRELILKLVNQNEDADYLQSVLTFAQYYKIQKEE